MEKSIYFVVAWSEAKQYSDALKSLGIRYVIETPEDIPTIEAGNLAIVFSSLPIRMYAKVKTLFGRNGEPY
ncbi:hypothetical protein [Brevibacillus sp. SYSU BS000544]|uniref:hypothetical protein n=1 Tax=Brevibacillus sp. SYSU BS000544 TaxID=3416443 RepID=UPI003CE45F4F